MVGRVSAHDGLGHWIRFRIERVQRVRLGPQGLIPGERAHSDYFVPRRVSLVERLEVGVADDPGRPRGLRQPVLCQNSAHHHAALR